MNQEEARDMASRMMRLAEAMVDRNHYNWSNPGPPRMMSASYRDMDADPPTGDWAEITFSPDPQSIVNVLIQCAHPMLADELRSRAANLIAPVLRQLPMALETVQGLEGEGEIHATVVLSLWTTRIPIVVDWNMPQVGQHGPSRLERVLCKLTTDVNRFIDTCQQVDAGITLSDDVVDGLVDYAAQNALRGSKFFQGVMLEIVSPVTPDVVIVAAGEHWAFPIPDHERLCALLWGHRSGGTLENPSIRNIKI